MQGIFICQRRLRVFQKACDSRTDRSFFSWVRGFFFLSFSFLSLLLTLPPSAFTLGLRHTLGSSSYLFFNRYTALPPGTVFRKDRNSFVFSYRYTPLSLLVNLQRSPTQLSLLLSPVSFTEQQHVLARRSGEKKLFFFFVSSTTRYVAFLRRTGLTNFSSLSAMTSSSSPSMKAMAPPRRSPRLMSSSESSRYTGESLQKEKKNKNGMKRETKTLKKENREEGREKTLTVEVSKELEKFRNEKLRPLNTHKKTKTNGSSRASDEDGGGGRTNTRTSRAPQSVPTPDEMRGKKERLEPGFVHNEEKERSGNHTRRYSKSSSLCKTSTTSAVSLGKREDPSAQADETTGEEKALQCKGETDVFSPSVDSHRSHTVERGRLDSSVKEEAIKEEEEEKKEEEKSPQFLSLSSPHSTKTDDESHLSSTTEAHQTNALPHPSSSSSSSLSPVLPARKFFLSGSGSKRSQQRQRERLEVSRFSSMKRARTRGTMSPHTYGGGENMAGGG